MPPVPRLLAALPAALLLLSASACGGASHASGVACAKGQLTTLEPGTLTLATGAVTRSPWVVGGARAGKSNDPRAGKGYDAAVGYALAERLGYDKAHVRWVGAFFPDTISKGPKRFDVSINQASISEDRRKDVDLSSPYWVVRDAVVTLKGRPLEDVTDLSGLARIPLAVVEGETTLRDGLTLVPYPDFEDVRRDVGTGARQGLVTDYNTALRVDQTETELVDGEMVALLPPVEGAPAYGMVLQKDSPLTACVNTAIAGLREDGTLDRLEQRWLVQEPGLHDLR